MSIHIMNAVFHYGPQDGSARLLLLALADNANERGEAYPSIAVLGQKACMSKSTVIRTLQRLAGEGWLVVRPRAGKYENAGRTRFNLYCLSLARLRLTGYSARGGDDDGAGVTLTPGEAQAVDEQALQPSRGVKMTPRRSQGVEAQHPERARGVNLTLRQSTQQDAHEVSKTASRGVKCAIPPTPPLVGEPSQNRHLPPPTPSTEGEMREAELVEAIEIQRRRSSSPDLGLREKARTETLRLQAELLTLKRASLTAAKAKRAAIAAAATPTEGMTVDELTAWVMVHCGFSGPESLRRAIHATLAAADEEERPQRAVAMDEAWLQYVRGPSRWSAQNFFRLGHWQHPASWPQGTRPFDPCAMQERATA